MTIIECKNYDKSKVVVSDLRELSSTLSEIGEHNTKGILITTSSFQKGAYDYAISTKIGIARVNINNEIDWISYRKDHKQHNFTDDIVRQNLYDQTIDKKNFFSFYNNKCFEKLPELLKEFEIIDNYKNALEYIAVPYFPANEIESIVSMFPQEIIFKDSFLDTHNLCNYCKETYNVKFTFDQCLKGNVLGKICFKPLEIFVSNRIEKDIYRWRFTLAHEVGHLILHKELLKKYINEQTDDELSLNKFTNENVVINSRLEVQANKFASRLLLPQRSFLQIVNDYFVKENINKGYLYFDRQSVNMVLGLNLLREIQYKFGVSKEVAKYRLIDLGLLKDATNIPIKRILRKGY